MNQPGAQFESARIYHDLNSLAHLKAPVSGKDSPEAIREAAKQFESIFVRMMLKSMRDASTALIDEPMFDSSQMDMYRDMHDDQLALHLGAEQGVGLTDLLVQQLGGGSQKNKASSILPEKVSLNRIENAKVESLRAEQKKRLAQTSAENTTEKAVTQLTSPVVENNAKSEVITGQENLSAIKVTYTTPNEQKTVSTKAKIEERGIDFSSPMNFVKSLWPHAVEAASKLTMDPKLLIAQAALETGWGQKVMRQVDGESSRNLFGIKARAGWDGKTTRIDSLEHDGVALKKQSSLFKSYASYQESFEDFIQFLTEGKRYQQALKVSQDPKAFTEELQKAGYATDPGYAKKIQSVYESPTLDKAVSSLSSGD